MIALVVKAAAAARNIPMGVLLGMPSLIWSYFDWSRPLMKVLFLPLLV
ncbi:hypothetical protein EV03_0627 [Prochlorococcus marinus str. PAC1]|uniref:Uncharacterized protein n=1 Tax=Prochlorococcus marinus str. PAC1 TaxID=59924 RepID=A0A0A2C4N4_PROMR|nr:hypothetical protein EV03_0627 [Prochlorococcus marinus str. PAC1]